MDENTPEDTGNGGPAVPVIVVSESPDSFATNDLHSPGHKRGLWIAAAILAALAMLSFSVGMIIALRESLQREDDAVDRSEQLEGSVECLRAPGTLFNTAVASSIILLVDINDANSTLNQASIDLNASLAQALIALRQDDDQALTEAIERANSVVATTEEMHTTTEELENRAAQVEADLAAAVQARADAIDNLCN